MSQTTRKETFFYNAHGNALSGQITTPFEHIIEAQAAASLSTVGGYGSARAADFRFKEIVSFRSASTQLAGTYDEKHLSYNTLASSTVEGLNILDVVTADRLTAHASGSWKPGDEESRIVSVGSEFDNLRIGGGRLEVELNADILVRLSTFAALRNEFERNPELRRIAEDPLQNGQSQKVPGANGVLLCSLVKEIKGVPPGVERRGNVLIVPQFGRIYLGEVLVWHATRTITTLRVEMGCPVTGTITGPGVTINGHTWP